MTLEFGLLLLESVLLVATIILLVYGIYEGKRRDALLKEVGRATRVLTRQEYFFSIMNAMLDAKREIIGCITGTPPSADDMQMTRHIADAIENMTRKGVIVKYLLPKFPDRLQIGVQYRNAGAEIHNGAEESCGGLRHRCGPMVVAARGSFETASASTSCRSG